MAADAARRRRLLLAGLFFASGAAGLVDQVVWLRYLALVFGNTTLATATLLAVFMAGLGFGALLFGRIADRTPRPLTLYALLELGVGLFALASPRLFALIDSAYVFAYREVGREPWLFSLVRVALAALCLGPPTVMMGGTLPLVLRAASGPDDRGAAGTALLYGANTLGAVAGVALAGFVTIRLLGLEASLSLAAALNLLAALGALALAGPLPGSSRAAAAPPSARGWLLAVAFLMGATSLAYEVLWTRVLVFYLGSSVYAFSLMLLLFLAGIALGSLALVRAVDRLARPLAWLAVVELGIALAAFLAIPLFTTLDARQIALSELLKPRGFGGALIAQLLAIAPIVLPPTLLMGLSFPLMVRALARRPEQLGSDVGALYGANTLGSILGALGAGFVLVPALGSQNGLLALAASNGLLALWIARRAPAAGERLSRGLVALALALPAVALLAGLKLPADRVILAAGVFRGDAPGDLLLFREDASAAVAVRRKTDAAGPYVSLELNGVNVAGTSADLYAVQKMQGHLPMLLGGRDGARVVHIGFGSGGTADAVAQHPVGSIRIVEISPAVLAASDRFFPEINHGVLADPRTAVEINDGRNFLLATAERFDAVLSDSIHPRYAGNGSLYSREYFALVAARLEPGGVVSMWLPTYTLTPRNYFMILRAFADVFPHLVVWYEPSALNPFTIVTGRREAGPWDAAAIARGFATPRVREALADLGVAGPAELFACYLAGAPELAATLAAVPPHVDDLPAVEYESGTLLAGGWTWLATFSELLRLRPAEPPPEILAALAPEDRARMRELWQERGQLLENHRAFLAQKVSPRR